jgi:hypothetical protein
MREDASILLGRNAQKKITKKLRRGASANADAPRLDIGVLEALN